MSELHECEIVGMDYFESAPVCRSATQRVMATGAQVFECFGDAEAWPRWAPAITRVEWTSPRPFGVGTTRTVHMRGGGVGEERFIAWEDGKRMAFCFTRTNLPSASFAEDYLVLDHPDGGVLVTWRMATTSTGPGAKIGFLTTPMIGLALKVMLGRFAALVEADYT